MSSADLHSAWPFDADASTCAMPFEVLGKSRFDQPYHPALAHVQQGAIEDRQVAKSLFRKGAALLRLLHMLN